MASLTTTPQTDAAHEAEVAQQEKIAQEVAVAPEAAVSSEEVNKVTLKPSDAVESYPLTVTVPGEELVFESESATVSVAPTIAEHVVYLPTVEAVA